MEYLLSIIMIDAHEGRDVENFDVPRTYLNADMPEVKFVVFKIGG